MGLEASSWDWLRNGIKKTVPHFSLLERVENGVLDGMADVNYVIRGVEGWIELKAVELPARPSTPVLGREGLRIPSQVNWHLARVAAHSRTWVFVTALPFRWLVSSVWAGEINNWVIDDFSAKARFWYDESWGPAQWSALVKALTI
jgi:hypothetical protein